MELWEKIECFLGREVDFINEVVLVDSGGGAEITGWNIEDTPPTQEQLNQITENCSYNLNKHKISKIQELGEACTSEINSYFTSSCLGTPHLYSYDEEAQKNLTIVMNAKDYYPPETTIEWRIHDTRELIQHTISQVVQLYLDSVAHVQTNVGKFRTLEAQVNSATTHSEVGVITW